MTATSTTSATRLPNFLFFFPDQHRPDWVPWNRDLPLRMPTLQRIADAGVRFARAVTPSPLCAPARACLASGRTYEACGVPNNNSDYPLDRPTYYKRLRETGYRVAGVGKFDLRKATMDWGLDGSRDIDTWGFTEGIDNEGKMDALASWLGQGGTRRVGGEPGKVGPRGPYMAYLQSRGLAEVHIEDFKSRRGAHGHNATHPTPLPPDAYCDTWIAENGLRFLRGFPQGQPWHLVVNFNGPHSPMDVTEEMHARWQGVDFPAPVTAQPLSDEERRTHNAVRQNYAAMLENIDTQVGRMLAVVEERGELENTVIVYSSDHGEMLGDHGRWGKSTYYQPSAGVPLAISGPGFRRGAASDALVSTHDLTATFLDLAGAAPLPEMDSRSLAPLLRGETERHRSHARSGLDEWRMVWDGRLKLAQTTLDSGEVRNRLFDLQTDPGELHDLAAERREEVQRLAPLLNPEVAG
ncbi:MAG TPA: sulfatase-like hydrolase/transferase [Chloroflexota bacterium]|nr:sulfatase-like hydrolase/transferase [Chloroflexota bacterium]